MPSNINKNIAKIKNLYFKKVHGRKPPKKRSKHDGRQGHWLEKQMGIKPNTDNKPDLFGFEMKNGTNTKTTFGDWSASKYIFESSCNRSSTLTRDNFLKFFGKPNREKMNRHSWSGSPCPKVNQYNDFGQILKVKRDNSIQALYSFSKDTRRNKRSLIPKQYQKEKLILAEWSAKDLKQFVENKFNQGGWFICKKNSAGEYSEICFGKSITFKTWISFVKKGIIFFDSGMYKGNSRFYSHWRANNSFWESLIIKRYSK